MYYELTWLGTTLLGVGAIALGVPAVWLIIRAIRDRKLARDLHGSRRRRLDRERDVVDHGLDTSVCKIPANQTARLKNEFANEGLEVFDSFEDAKAAALLIVNRHGEASKQGPQRFSFQSDPQIDSLKYELSGLTEDRVKSFFL